MAYLASREADLEGACSDSLPSSSASEDALDLSESEVSLTRLEGSVHTLLLGIGEEAQREGLRETPRRVAKAWLDATEGYRQTVHSVLGGALFHEDISSRRENSVVLIRDVDFASTSEHNLLPFFGRCHIAYVPRNGIVLGLSKVARLAKMFSRRLQDQQRLTDQLLEAFDAEVRPLGCAAVVEACQLGLESRESLTTASVLGCFQEQPEVFFQEFAVLLGKPHLLSSALPHRRCQSRHPHSCACSLASEAGVRSPPPLSSGPLAAASSDQPRRSAMVTAVKSILRELGEDVSRQGLEGSSERYVDHLLASTSGIPLQSPQPTIVGGLAPINASHWQAPAADELCIPFTSQCEHHLLPFQGSIQIVCIPGASGLRLSRGFVDALVCAYSRRLQIQERLTHQIADAIHAECAAAGTLVLCHAAHMCMVARGVEKHASSTLTLAAYGVFETNHQLRSEALERLCPRLEADS